MKFFVFLPSETRRECTAVKERRLTHPSTAAALLALVSLPPKCCRKLIRFLPLLLLHQATPYLLLSFSINTVSTVYKILPVLFIKLNFCRRPARLACILQSLWCNSDCRYSDRRKQPQHLHRSWWLRGSSLGYRVRGCSCQSHSPHSHLLEHL